MKATVLDMSTKCTILGAFDVQELDSAIARVSGVFNSGAEHYPEALCRVDDVQKIFDRLFDMRFGKAESPAAGTARESK